MEIPFLICPITQPHEPLEIDLTVGQIWALYSSRPFELPQSCIPLTDQTPKEVFVAWIEAGYWGYERGAESFARAVIAEDKRLKRQAIINNLLQ